MKRKALALALTLFIMLMAVIPAVAADKGTITITNSNDAVSMNGHRYTAYKIFDVTYNTAKTSYDYTIASPFEAYFNSKSLPASMGEDLNARAYTYVSSISGAENLQTFAKEIYPYRGAEAGHVDATSQTAQITNLDIGYYLIYDEGTSSSSPTNPEKAVANIALTTNNPDATVILKASVPTIEKKITGVSDTASNTASATGEPGVSASINQHVGFQIDSIVPDLTGYTNYTYKVRDTMSDGLEPDNNVKVMIGSTDETSSSIIEYSGQTVTITVPFSVLHPYLKDTPITITYSARVKANANVYPSATPNTNEATLEYSNDVDNLTITDTTPTSKNNIYLFSIVATKVNASGAPLENAQFVLKDNNGDFIPVALNAGRYAVSDTLPATEANATVKSPADGIIYIDGLSEGTYTLTETVAPDTYNLLKNPVSFTISATYDTNGELLSVAGNTKTIVNKSGGILPSTGGMGTLVFTAGGVAVMIAAIAAVVIKKRKETAE